MLAKIFVTVPSNRVLTLTPVQTVFTTSTRVTALRVTALHSSTPLVVLQSMLDFDS